MPAGLPEAHPGAVQVGTDTSILRPASDGSRRNCAHPLSARAECWDGGSWGHCVLSTGATCRRVSRSREAVPGTRSFSPVPLLRELWSLSKRPGNGGWQGLCQTRGRAHSRRTQGYLAALRWRLPAQLRPPISRVTAGRGPVPGSARDCWVCVWGNPSLNLPARFVRGMKRPTGDPARAVPCRRGSSSGLGTAGRPGRSPPSSGAEEPPRPPSPPPPSAGASFPDRSWRRSGPGSAGPAVTGGAPRVPPVKPGRGGMWRCRPRSAAPSPPATGLCRQVTTAGEAAPCVPSPTGRIFPTGQIFASMRGWWWTLRLSAKRGRRALGRSSRRRGGSGRWKCTERVWPLCPAERPRQGGRKSPRRSPGALISAEFPWRESQSAQRPPSSGRRREEGQGGRGERGALPAERRGGSRGRAAVPGRGAGSRRRGGQRFPAGGWTLEGDPRPCCGLYIYGTQERRSPLATGQAASGAGPGRETGSGRTEPCRAAPCRGIAGAAAAATVVPFETWIAGALHHARQTVVASWSKPISTRSIPGPRWAAASTTSSRLPCPAAPTATERLPRRRHLLRAARSSATSARTRTPSTSAPTSTPPPSTTSSWPTSSSTASSRRKPRPSWPGISTSTPCMGRAPPPRRRGTSRSTTSSRSSAAWPATWTASSTLSTSASPRRACGRWWSSRSPARRRRWSRRPCRPSIPTTPRSSTRPTSSTRSPTVPRPPCTSSPGTPRRPPRPYPARTIRTTRTLPAACPPRAPSRWCPRTTGANRKRQ